MLRFLSVSEWFIDNVYSFIILDSLEKLVIMTCYSTVEADRSERCVMMSLWHASIGLYVSFYTFLLRTLKNTTYFNLSVGKLFSYSDNNNDKIWELSSWNQLQSWSLEQKMYSHFSRHNRSPIFFKFDTHIPVCIRLGSL